MKKIILILLILFLSYNSFSQKYYYGVLAGTNLYDIEADNILAGGAISDFNIGFFVERNFDEKFGIKTYLMFTQPSESIYAVRTEGDNYDFNFFSKLKLKTVQLHLLTIYDVKNTYDKGFYFLGGLKISKVLNVSSDRNQEFADDFFKANNLGILLGFGVKFAKNISFEVVGDRNITGIYNSSRYKTKQIGAYGNLLINLESFLQKK